MRGNWEENVLIAQVQATERRGYFYVRVQSYTFVRTDDSNLPNQDNSQHGVSWVLILYRPFGDLVPSRIYAVTSLDLDRWVGV